jgi:putative FmdB family regulatory protein
LPTYQYACTECGHRFEAVQSFTDDALTDCPQCTGRLRKVFNSVGIVFKGSGFYRTDSREKVASGAGKDGSTDKAASAPTDGAKTDGAKTGASTPAASSTSPSGSATTGSTTAGSSASSTSGSAA